MNRAAEAAVPRARPPLVDAVKAMNVEDARRIIKGGDKSVITFFAGKTRESLGVTFLPIVARATERLALAAKYNAIAARASTLGLLNKEDANLQQYVTGKAIDGLYLNDRRRREQDPA